MRLSVEDVVLDAGGEDEGMTVAAATLFDDAQQRRPHWHRGIAALVPRCRQDADEYVPQRHAASCG